MDFSNYITYVLKISMIRKYHKISQTADKPMAPRGRATQQSQDTRNTIEMKLTFFLIFMNTQIRKVAYLTME